MPVTYNESKSKWCMGENCNYDTKEKAEAAERAYHANMEKKKTSLVNILKNIDEEKRIFTSVVLKANYRDDDGENQDWWDEEVVEQAAHDFMLKCQQGNLQHVINTDLLKVVESYISPVSFEMGQGTVQKGDWVMSTYIPDDDLWQLAKDGIFKGYSVGCGAIVETEEEDED